MSTNERRQRGHTLGILQLPITFLARLLLPTSSSPLPVLATRMSPQRTERQHKVSRQAFSKCPEPFQRRSSPLCSFSEFCDRLSVRCKAKVSGTSVVARRKWAYVRVLAPACAATTTTTRPYTSKCTWGGYVGTSPTPSTTTCTRERSNLRPPTCRARAAARHAGTGQARRRLGRMRSR